MNEKITQDDIDIEKLIYQACERGVGKPGYLAMRHRLGGTRVESICPKCGIRSGGESDSDAKF